MKRLFISLRTLLLLFLVFHGLPCSSAQPSGTFPQFGLPAAIDPLTGKPIPHGPKFDIAFEGGPAYYFVEVLREKLSQADTNVAPNVIIAPSMQEAQIPSFQLKNVTVADVFNALNQLQDPKNPGTWQPTGSTETIWVLNPVQTGDGHLTTPGELKAYNLGRRNATAELAEPRATRIFPVAGYLQDYAIEDITTAIETAWGLMSEPTPAEMKFHQDTKLLIAVGNNDQLNLASEVLNSLNLNIRIEASQREQPAPAVPPGKTD